MTRVNIILTMEYVNDATKKTAMNVLVVLGEEDILM